MKEAKYYKRENSAIKCLLCPHECMIQNNKTGICSIRKNIDGKLYSLVYEKPVAIHIDPIEKKPLYHFHPRVSILSVGTYGCNLSCRFCQNYDISQIKSQDIDFDTIRNLSPEGIVDICSQRGIKFVAFTYNEPTIYYEYMLETAKVCKKNRINTVVVSNGQINPNPLKELIQYIDAFNIDLKAFNEKFYKNICGGYLETTKNSIEIITEHKKHLEVTFLLIKGYNDNLSEFCEMCSYLAKLNDNIVLHISRAFPRYKLKFDVTPVYLIEDFYKNAKKHLRNVYMGNI